MQIQFNSGWALIASSIDPSGNVVTIAVPLHKVQAYCAVSATRTRLFIGAQVVDIGVVDAAADAVFNRNVGSPNPNVGASSKFVTFQATTTGAQLKIRPSGVAYIQSVLGGTTCLIVMDAGIQMGAFDLSPTAEQFPFIAVSVQVDGTRDSLLAQLTA